MKATILAKFFDELSRQQIPFSVDEIKEQSYTEAFGVKEVSSVMADGIYLQIWASKNSLCDDVVTEFLHNNMYEEFRGEGNVVKVYNAPTNDVDHDDWLYIIKIED